MKTTDFIKEEFDSSEYNDEAGMVKTNLHTIARMCKVLDKHLEDDENMAEWAQEKVAVVKSMIVTVKDYVASEHARDAAKTVAETTSGGTSSASVATSMGGDAGFGKSIFMKRSVPKKAKKK